MNYGSLLSFDDSNFRLSLRRIKPKGLTGRQKADPGSIMPHGLKISNAIGVCRQVELTAVFAALLMNSFCLHARAVEAEFQPPLADVFPFVEASGSVKVLYPVLINEKTILKTSAVLRFVYMWTGDTRRPGNPGQNRIPGNEDGGHHKHARAVGIPAEGGVSTSGVASGGGSIGEIQEKPESATLGTQKVIHETVWHRISDFTSEMADAGKQTVRIVFLDSSISHHPGELERKPQESVKNAPKMPPTGPDIWDELIEPVDGLILTEKDGTITVLSIAKDCTFQAFGIQAGDRITQIENVKLSGSLAEYVKVRETIRNQITNSGKSKYSILFRNIKNEEKAAELFIRAPLNKSLLDVL